MFGEIYASNLSTKYISINHCLHCLEDAVWILSTKYLSTNHCCLPCLVGAVLLCKQQLLHGLDLGRGNKAAFTRRKEREKIFSLSLNFHLNFEKKGQLFTGLDFARDKKMFSKFEFCLFQQGLPGLHKTKLESQIKKLFGQFHYFSKAVPISQSLLPK